MCKDIPRVSAFTFVNEVIILICSSCCDEQQCILEFFSVVFYQTFTKIFQYFRHEKKNSLRGKCFFLYCSNTITKKLDTMKMPLNLV